MVDGAHAFAHLDFTIPDLDCDYYGASLHKWLGAPLGAGILYVRRDRIERLWPIYGDAGCRTPTSASSTTPARTRCTPTSRS